jgi:hypothetical protein
MRARESRKILRRRLVAVCRYSIGLVRYNRTLYSSTSVRVHAMQGELFSLASLGQKDLPQNSKRSSLILNKI